MSLTQRLNYEAIRSQDTSVATSYTALGTPLKNPASIVKMVNLSNKNLIVSVDGVNDYDICTSGGFFLYDITSDSPKTTAIFVPQGTQYYVRTSDGAAGSGLVYLVVQYIVNV